MPHHKVADMWGAKTTPEFWVWYEFGPRDQGTSKLGNNIPGEGEARSDHSRPKAVWGETHGRGVLDRAP